MIPNPHEGQMLLFSMGIFVGNRNLRRKTVTAPPIFMVFP